MRLFQPRARMVRVMFTIVLTGIVCFTYVTPPGMTAGAADPATEGVAGTATDSVAGAAAATDATTGAEGVATVAANNEWLIKWKAETTAEAVLDLLRAEIPSLELIRISREHRVMVVKVAGEEAVLFKDEKMHGWSQAVEYIQPNYRYQAHVQQKNTLQPNDPRLTDQSHLHLINAGEGWEVVRSNTDILIALLDTGVDASHPDLAANLVNGVNMLDPSGKPVDDNGHGTRVAGILGAVGNNKAGISGVLWQAKMMPVKILDQDGVGDDFTVGMGMRKAVDLGAKVLVMPLGLPLYSSHLEEAVEYALSKNRVVVAATGNEGSRINYPAALPGVISVGAVDSSGKPLSYVNIGPEMDIVAPGVNILTTARGGGYERTEGTSMAAPQVAGLVALLLKQHPGWTSSQIQSHIQYTARDVAAKGWDRETGHGLIDMGKALTTKPVEDVWEPNNKREQAKLFPIENQINSQLTASDQEDWYRLDAPYRGKIVLDISFAQPLQKGISLVHVLQDGSTAANHLVKKDGTVELTVAKGVSYIRLANGEEPAALIQYKIKNRFRIAADAYESNDTRETAYPLSGSTSVTGTIHRDGDQDWFSYVVKSPGKLEMQLTVDTLRFDPVLYVERAGGAGMTRDEGSVERGQAEYAKLEVQPGTYYIRVHHFFDHHVMGQYVLNVTFTAEKKDANEPNNTSATATPLAFNQSKKGTLPQLSDFDWFRFSLGQDSSVNLKVTGVPPGSRLRVFWYDNSFTPILQKELSNKEQNWYVIRNLGPGTYYLRLDALQEIRYDQYSVLVKRDVPLAYADTWGHWARFSINKLHHKGVVTGYQDKTFRPDRPVTRAELVAQLLRVIENKELGITFKPLSAARQADNREKFALLKDVSKTHWGYSMMEKAFLNGLLSGYPDRTIRMDLPVSRGEAAVLMSRMLNRVAGSSLPDSGISGTDQPFDDVVPSSWMYKEVMDLRTKGYVEGYEGNRFAPERGLTRGELAALIDRMFIAE